MPSQRHGLSCLYLTQVYDWSGWKELDPLGEEKVTLTEKRYSHTSWKSPEGEGKVVSHTCGHEGSLL